MAHFHGLRHACETFTDYGELGTIAARPSKCGKHGWEKAVHIAPHFQVPLLLYTFAPSKKTPKKTILRSRVKYCAHFRVAPALIARKRVQAHTNVERRHITRLTISGAEARRIVRYADARPQSFTLREEARSCLAALSQLSRSTLPPVIVERHLVSGCSLET